ncbi:hypothetical protein EV361DRAFT_938078 [Lentinula raphanica]|nr:hypothetical protein EV361DRAFT_938078 [Lentinula raphanica]
MASSSQDLNSTEALQALLQSFGPNAAQNVSQEALQRLSDRLSEMLGADVVRDAFAYRDQEGQANGTRNETLLNEEGLPIIDITEPDAIPGQSSSQSNVSATPSQNNPIASLEEAPLVNLSTLSASERDLRKRERERILDMLEAEEVLADRREREKERQERREALDKRREDGKTERERLLELKETHKKMGKALLRSVVSNDDHEGEEAKQPSTPSSPTPSPSKEPGKTPEIKKKSVSFAADDEVEAVSPEPSPKPSQDIVDWGDVSQGRLRSKPKTLPVRDSYARQSEQLMKLQVVERSPNGQSNPSRNNDSTQPPPPPPSTSKIQIIDAPTGDSDDESDVDSPLLDDEPVLEDSDTEHSDVEPGNSDLDEETDWDFAQHQREIALEYHQKRDKIGRETAAAFINHTHPSDQEPSDVQISSDQPKPASSISQFRANRMASSYAVANNVSASSSSTSTSTLPTMIPADSARTLQNAVRLGRLDEQGRLVGGEPGDSGSEPDDEIAREVLEILQRGEAYNIGPNGEIVHASPPPDASGGTLSAKPVPPPFTPPKEPLPEKPKASKFKLMHTRTERSPSQGSPSVDSSGSSTPLSTVGRSSPKIVAMESSVVERTAPQASSSKPQSEIISSAISPNVNSALSSSMIVESPSFPSSTSSQRRPERPPAIMSSQVVESSSSRRTEDAKTEAAPKRVSRFKAERM